MARLGQPDDGRNGPRLDRRRVPDRRRIQGRTRPARAGRRKGALATAATTATAALIVGDAASLAGEFATEDDAPMAGSPFAAPGHTFAGRQGKVSGHGADHTI